jgi:hypothetical protein
MAINLQKTNFVNWEDFCVHASKVMLPQLRDSVTWLYITNVHAQLKFAITVAF